MVSDVAHLPLVSVRNMSVTSCEGSSKNGPLIYLDFYKINRPCSCILTPSFNGELLFTSRKEITYFCETRITIHNYFVVSCPSSPFSQTLSVEINQSVDVRAESVSTFTPGIFFFCLGFQQNGGLSGNLKVVCGSPNAAETTTIKTSTKNVSSTTRLSITSSVVSSMGPSTVILKEDTNVTKTTAAFLSEERICGHQDISSKSLLSLQIPLAIFVVISTVSTILNIYFYIHSKSRNNFSRKYKDNSDVIINQPSGNKTIADIYTELENTVSRESENQYDSITHQDNYINTNAETF